MITVSLVAAVLLTSQAASGEPPANEPPTSGITSGTVAVGQPQPTSPPGDTEPDSDYAIPTTVDRVGRIVVPVMVNGRGPFRFILDTGANATVISPHLANLLGLPVDTSRTVVMNGVTGGMIVPTASVDSIETHGLALEGQRLAVSDASGIGTDGVLGVDALWHKVVLVDFNSDSVRVYEASAHRPSDALTRLPAKLRLGNLLMVDALVSTHKIKAIIDTGGQRTLGNPALYAMLGYRHETAARDAAADVIGATNAKQPGERRIVHSVVMGDLRVANLVVTFGDFHIFKLWNLGSQPALVIGMDMIGTLGQFGVDYLRREVDVHAGQYVRHKRKKT
jgi:predicted aspartyl protease